MLSQSSLLLITLCLFLSACSSAPVVQQNPSVLFQEGEEFYANRNYEDAIAQWKRVKETYASPELTALAEVKIADAQFEAKNYIEAAASYEDFRKLHPGHEKAAYALYRIGLCNYNQIEGIDVDQTPVKNADIMFDAFLRQYPASEYAPDARSKLEAVRTKQLQHEIYVGRFYYIYGKYPAAVKRLEETLVRFPTSPLNDETLYYLGAAYLQISEKEKGRNAFNRLVNEYPSSQFLPKAAKILEKYY